MKDSMGAMHDFQAAIRNNSSYSLAYFNAANIYFKNRQYRQVETKASSHFLLRSNMLSLLSIHHFVSGLISSASSFELFPLRISLMIKMWVILILSCICINLLWVRIIAMELSPLLRIIFNFRYLYIGTYNELLPETFNVCHFCKFCFSILAYWPP